MTTNQKRQYKKEVCVAAFSINSRIPVELWERVKSKHMESQSALSLHNYFNSEIKRSFSILLQGNSQVQTEAKIACIELEY